MKINEDEKMRENATGCLANETRKIKSTSGMRIEIHFNVLKFYELKQDFSIFSLLLTGMSDQNK